MTEREGVRKRVCERASGDDHEAQARAHLLRLLLPELDELEPGRRQRLVFRVCGKGFRF